MKQKPNMILIKEHNSDKFIEITEPFSIEWDDSHGPSKGWMLIEPKGFIEVIKAHGATFEHEIIPQKKNSSKPD